jgi:prepilin-type N-terminal cleavage/methylation domain-containing protein
MCTAPSNQRGFTLVELLMVIAVLGIVAAMAIGVSPAFLQQARADSGIAQATDVFRAAREIAISQRRNVQVRFIGQDVIQIARVNIPDNSTTILRSVQLENRMRFMLVPGLPDTPDLFGNAAAVSFGPSANRMFTSEGTFVDNTGDVLNGTLFMAVPGEPNSARAISVFGATAFLRTWRWNGSAWVE